MKPTNLFLAILCTIIILGNLCAISQDLDLGLIAHYPFNGNADDISGNINNGTVYNTVLTEDRFGKVDSAYDFNGLNAYIQIPNSTSLSSPTNEISQVAWIYIYGYSLTGFNFSPIFMKSNSSENAFQYRMYISPSGLGASFNNWNNIGTNYFVFNAYEWHMIATTLKEDTVKTYINGELLGYALVNGTMTTDTRPLELGRDVPGAIEHFYGKMDDMRLYNRALTAEEVALLYTPGAIGKDVDLKVILEGPFNATIMNSDLNAQGLLPLNQPFNQTPWNYPGVESVSTIPNGSVVDWILVEFRVAPDAASATSSTTVARKAAFILEDGSIVDLDGTTKIRYNGTYNNDLFVVVWHRNHLGILSANPVSETATQFEYDFTNAATQAYGGSSTQKMLNTGIFGMYAGNANGDNEINLTDITNFWTNSAGFNNYNSSDLNFDGQIDNKDKNDILIFNLGKISYVP